MFGGRTDAKLNVFSPSPTEQQLLMKSSALSRGQDGIYQLSWSDEVILPLLLGFNHLVRCDHPAEMSV